MMILYHADMTEFLQEFKVFSHLGVCVLMLVITKTHTHGSGATVTHKLREVLSRPTWCLSGAQQALPWDLWEHLTHIQWSQLCRSFHLSRATAYHDTVATCHSVTIVHVWVLRMHPCHTSWNHVVQGWMALIDSDGSVRLKLARIRLRSK